MPELKSVGYAKVPGGWISYIMTTKGREVVSIDEVSEPCELSIAIDLAKVDMQTKIVEREAVL